MNLHNRSIIHLNVADFAVAVERALDCRLNEHPVIIAPEGAARAAVYDMSNEAYMAGIRKGMALHRAVRLCKDVKILPPHPDRYELAMRDVLKRALPYSPLIETGETDGHLFMDASGTTRLFGPPMDMAHRLRKQIKTDLGLNPIWSVAPNKLVAKVATRLVKPDGEYVVAGGEEESLLAPLPVVLVPGIERDDQLRLREFNLVRVSQVAALSLEQLEIPFGPRALSIYEAVRGIDPSPVLPVGQKPPKVMAEYEFGNDTNNEHTIEAVLYRLVEEAGNRLRRRRLAARRIAIILDYSDGMRRARQMAARPATANDLCLFERARHILQLAWMRRVRIRHMRLICDRLVFPPAQLELFAGDQKAAAKRCGLIKAVDAIRHRFGPEALRFGRTLATQKERCA
jgi:DNA polymerase-4